jgi:hypothetical protein
MDPKTKMKSLIVFTGFVVVILTLLSTRFIFDNENSAEDSCGEVIQERTVKNEVFEIKSIVRRQNTPIVPGACYSFYSKNAIETNWKKVFSVRFDEILPSTYIHATFVDDKTGYVFLGENYAVTTDAGHSWELWNADEFFERVAYPKSRSIEDVKILPDGTGLMKLFKHPNDSSTVTLITADFGKMWQLSPSNQNQSR